MLDFIYLDEDLSILIHYSYLEQTLLSFDGLILEPKSEIRSLFAQDLRQPSLSAIEDIDTIACSV